MKKNPAVPTLAMAFPMALAIALGAASAPALAEEPVLSPYFQQYFYGAVDIGQSRATDACPAGASGCSNTAAVARAGLGYQFVSNFGAEITYGYYGKASLGTAGATALGDWKASGFELAGVGAVPVSDAFAVTGKIGIAPTTYERTGTGRSVTTTNLAWGLGVRYTFTPGFALRAQYEDLGNVGDVNVGQTHIRLITAGVVAKF